MTTWKKFEIECKEFLEESFKGFPFLFESKGASNSTSPDIEVFDSNGQNILNIEVKLSPSQSGQFVVAKNNNLFQLTTLSKFSNSNTQQIIDFINNKSNVYLDFNNGNLDINCNKDLMYNWVIEHYKSKNSFFLITSNSRNSFKAVIPINEIENYFDISACLRKKRSGTRHLPKKYLKDTKIETQKYLNSIGEEIVRFKPDGKKTIVELKNKIEVLEKEKRYYGTNIFLSPEENIGDYSIKIQSTTNNINVIFSLVYKGPETNIGVDLLKEELVKE